MRIVFVTSSYLPRVNGVSLSVQACRRVLQSMGHEITVVAPDYPGYDDAEEGIIRIRSHYFFASPEDRIPDLLLPSSRAKIRRLLDKDFDILHSHVPFFFLEFPAVRWARKTGCPLVHTYHTHWELYTHYLKPIPPLLLIQYLRPVLSRFLNKHDLILSPSSQMVDVLRSYNVRRRIEVLPTGIDRKAFRRGRAGGFRRRWRIAEGATLLLTVGRIVREKNIPFLYDVLQRVRSVRPDTVLLLAGDGPERPELEARAARMGLSRHVRFPGYLSHDELIPAYHAADVFVFASLTETQGIVLAEAMAAGTPVVAVSALGVVDILQGNRGGLLVPEDVGRFTDALMGLLTDPGTYRRKSAEARECSGRWSIQSSAERLLGFYQELVDERRSRRPGKRASEGSECGPVGVRQ